MLPVNSYWLFHVGELWTTPSSEPMKKERSSVAMTVFLKIKGAFQKMFPLNGVKIVNGVKLA